MSVQQPGGGGANVTVTNASLAVTQSGAWNVGINVALPAGSNLIGGTTPTGAATTGATPFHLPSSAASNNATNVKGSAGTVYNIVVTNTNAAVRYLKLYDKATAPTVGTDTPIMTVAVPPNSGGYSIPLPVGLKFTLGIGFGMTVNAADADNTAVAAGDLVGFNLAYV